MASLLVRFTCVILLVCPIRFLGLSTSSPFTHSTSPHYVFQPSTTSSQSPGLSFTSFVEFFAMFLGCGQDTYEPFLEVSYLENSRPINLFFILADSKAKKQAYSISVSLSSPSTRNKNSRHALFLFSLLFISGSVELNPGPTYKYPCGDCSRPCRKDQPGIQCDNCLCWYHKKCLQMNSHIYEALANSSISWICCQCGLPNFSSSLFESSNSLESKNSFSLLQNLSDPVTHSYNPPLSPFRPTRASTPSKTSQPPPTQGESSQPHRPKFRRNTLTSLLINFRSFLCRKDLVNNLVNHLSSSVGCGIIFGTETWLKENILNSELNLEEFHIYRNDRTEKGGGGVFLCVKKIYNSILICKGKQSETVFVKINIPGKSPIVLCCAYRAPDLSLDDCMKLCDEIREVKSKFKNCVFWLSGDFNLPDIDWKSNKIIGKQYSLSINQLFLDLAQDLGLTQTVHDPTRGTNTLDLFFSNYIYLISKTSVISGVSDHEAVTIESKLSLNPKKAVPRDVQL